MEALEIEGQTNSTPLTGSCLNTSQRELAETEHLFDDADHRFNGAFAYPIDGFAQGRPELVGHFYLDACVLRRWSRQGCETLLPTGMMGITPRGDVGLDAPLRTRLQGRGAEIPSIQCCCLGRADL